MKKIVLALTASVLAVSLMAATTAGAKRTAAPPTLKPGTLIVGMTVPSPGFEVGTFKGTTINNPKGMEVDLAKALAKSAKAKKFFDSLSSANRYAILYRLQEAKKPETRLRRLAKFVDMLKAGEKLYP